MKNKHIIIGLLCCVLCAGYSQGDSTQSYRNFPLIITLQFHSFSMPFKNIKSNFSNIGIGIGTEVSYNKKSSGVQQLHLLWYRNKNMGNGLMVYSQAVWRPAIGSNGYTELKLGAGYLLSKRPSESYIQNNSEWISVGKKAKGMFIIPIGLSVGYENENEETYVSPFASYQFLVASSYNKSIPVVPYTLIQLGSRIHFEDQ
ncbi:hypothetical protein U6A24_20610 [Aquimarina gracilis]|uniref:Outer membrane protein with beta-barrel domain n=1 Tax=Aquimarina gracilis TaxID=874422 RepID=A0ABU6A192_9FLAO|nr:hypothetical protein [Aquimarina gracilis]MEB3347891.1 hypothetical protein [Aquimarina gracilis]